MHQTQTNEKRKRNQRKMHDTQNEWTIHETNARYMNEMKQTNYTENANERYTKRTNDTRTNESLEHNHILSNDKRSWFYRSTI
jgi:hypothetical protein